MVDSMSLADRRASGCVTPGFVMLSCNDAALMECDERWTIAGDPTEGALLVAARKAGIEPEYA